MNKTEEKSWIVKINGAGKINTPYLLTDLDVVSNKVNGLKALLPRLNIFYAVKSNNDPRIIRTLKSLVEGFDIASVGEFRLLQNLGIAPDRILYSNPVKIPHHIREAYKGGVSHFALDSTDEIDKLSKYAPGSTIYLRLKVSDYGSKFPLSSKFGIDPKKAVNCAMAAQRAGLKVGGLTFHVGSQAENPHVWDAALSICGVLIKDLESIGIKIEFINIGGGLPASYEDVAPTAKEAAKVINDSLNKYLSPDIRVLAEPGRYISANSSVIVTTVIGRENRSGTEWLYLDMGVFQGLIEALEIGLKYPVFTPPKMKGDKESFVLTGPSCDAYDTLGLNYMLPSDIKVGDQIYIGAVGAYSLVYASSFNGFDPPMVRYVKKSGAVR